MSETKILNLGVNRGKSGVSMDADAAIAKAQPVKPTPERILCAAIWYQDGQVHEQQPVETGYVACGHRHCNIHTQPRADRLMPSVQGFLTSNGEFASRRVALRIARAAGQLEGRTKHPPMDQLLSEDLY